MSQSGSGRVSEKAFDAALAEEVRALLSRRRITQAAVRKHMGLSANAMSRRWSGATPWTMAELITLSDWLGVDAAEVMGTAKKRATETARRDSANAPRRAHATSVSLEDARASLERERLPRE